MLNNDYSSKNGYKIYINVNKIYLYTNEIKSSFVSKIIIN